MTALEAIKWIRLDIEMAKFDPTTGEEAYLNDDAKKVIEAQEMAINVLEAWEQLANNSPKLDSKFGELISKRTENTRKTHSCDYISRRAAIDALHMHLMYRMGTDSNKKRLDDWINNLPSAQPERTCVNCGRTANNGGWYADGGTRCPIEEHYALPKDGYCHLWEKRNVTDDDYPERREE